MSVTSVFTFKRKEIIGFLVIFLVIIVLTLLNYQSAYARERDIKRNMDITEIAKALEKYKADFSVYPLSSPCGKILACSREETDILRDSLGRGVVAEGAVKTTLINLISCEWGRDALHDVGDNNYPYYLDVLPQDPKQDKGYSYLYVSDGIKYQIFTAYETKSTIDYRKEIKKAKLKCGVNYCNAGRTVGATIVEKI